jgi:cell division protein FtsB
MSDQDEKKPTRYNLGYLWDTCGEDLGVYTAADVDPLLEALAAKDEKIGKLERRHTRNTAVWLKHKDEQDARIKQLERQIDLLQDDALWGLHGE